MHKNRPEELLATSYVLGVEGAVNLEERRGQVELSISKNKLPIEGDREGWEALIEAGVVKGEAVDDLFINVTLPQGWEIKTSDHRLWSYLYDERGLKRAAIFYKSVCYDRKATLHGYAHRFYATQYFEDEDSDAAAQFGIIDQGTGKTIRVFNPVYYAIHNDDLGAVFQGKFFCEIDKETGFQGEGIGELYAEVMTRDEFFKNFHHVSPRHDLIEAVEKLARQEAADFLANIPKRLEQWDKEFDFPAILSDKRGLPLKRS
jgi:hypothetical protein